MLHFLHCYTPPPIPKADASLLGTHPLLLYVERGLPGFAVAGLVVFDSGRGGLTEVDVQRVVYKAAAEHLRRTRYDGIGQRSDIGLFHVILHIIFHFSLFTLHFIKAFLPFLMTMPL